jgi:peroxiredoxin
MTFVFVLLFIIVIALQFASIHSEIAPAFNIHSTANERVSLADFAGRALVLMLMTSRCPACRALSHSELRALYDDVAQPDSLLKGRVAILSVSVQDTMGEKINIIFSNIYLYSIHSN